MHYTMYRVTQKDGLLVGRGMVIPPKPSRIVASPAYIELFRAHILHPMRSRWYYIYIESTHLNINVLMNGCKKTHTQTCG